jgi:hypothetical protein
MTPEVFIKWFPRFEGETPERIQFCLTRAEPHLDPERWGDLYDEGLASLAAHYLATSSPAAAAEFEGGVLSGKSKSVGDVSVSRSFAVSAKAGEDPLLATTYGQAFRMLARQVGMGAIAV